MYITCKLSVDRNWNCKKSLIFMTWKPSLFIFLSTTNTACSRRHNTATCIMADEYELIV